MILSVFVLGILDLTTQERSACLGEMNGALLKKHLYDEGISSILYDEYEGSSYGSAMRWVAHKMAEDKVTVAIELHFNSASPTASGCEMLYYHNSTQGKRLATMLQREVIVEYNTKNRGIKPMQRFSRGGGFLVKTKGPAVICEPFFGSNEREWRMFSTSSWLSGVGFVPAPTKPVTFGVLRTTCHA